ncbi:MAG: S9 family peptidase [Opitutaceae bacterium]|nr:S9 family peptidase [Opitutaceae bacterium]
MRLPCALVFLCFALSARAEPLPIEEFAHMPMFDGMTLSPDGKTVAYVETVKGRQKILMRNLDTNKVMGIEIPNTGRPWVTQGTRLDWLNSHRLLFSLYPGGFSAMDKDGKRYEGLTGKDRYSIHQGTYLTTPYTLFNFYDEQNGTVLLTEYDTAYAVDGIGANLWVDLGNRPHVLKVNSRTGGFERVEENPGDIAQWVPDANGALRVAVQTKKGVSRVVYRATVASPWQPLPGADFSDPAVRPLAFSGDNQTLYVVKYTADRHWAVYPFDFRTMAYGEALVTNDTYDIIPVEWRSFANGVAQQALVFAPGPGGRLLGVRYLTDYPRVRWFDETMARHQAAIDATLPGKANTIVSMSADLNRMLVLSWAAHDPGTYYLYETEGPKLSKLLARMPWVDPEKMAQTVAIKFKARDGQRIHGYLTLPKGRGQKNLPMVVMPHGGPRTRDVWGYDPYVQFLANRGYAVLQVDYRGSAGYGDAFLKKGRRKVGTDTQHDITDAARWAIAKGLADPKRVAIMGASFGGYSAMMGVATEPGLYRCAINIAGVTDWIELIKEKANVFPRSYGPTVSIVGDPVKDAAELRATSPRYLARNIKVPVLMIHGRDDPVVPYSQAKLMAEALQEAGGTYELMAKYNEAHGLDNYKNVIEAMERIGAFLQRNMPAN